MSNIFFSHYIQFKMNGLIVIIDNLTIGYGLKCKVGKGFWDTLHIIIAKINLTFA